MSAKRFIDTNIWLYALFEPADDEAEKHRLAARLTLEEIATAISEQVIQHTALVLLGAPGLSPVPDHSAPSFAGQVVEL